MPADQITRRLKQAMLRAGEPGGSALSVGQRSPTNGDIVRPRLEERAAAWTQPTVDAADRSGPGMTVSLQAG